MTVAQPVGADSVGDRKRLIAACRLALDVVRAGEKADPHVPPPPALVSILGFSRLSGAAFAAIARTVDHDPALRARVAAEAHESDVGRTGWLWLHRPDGWLADPAWTGGPVPPDPSRNKAGRRADPDAGQQARVAGQAAADRRRALEQLGEAGRALVESRAEAAALRTQLTKMTEQRHGAVRAVKRLEADLAQARRELKVAREATRQAEAELLARRADVDAGDTSEPVVDVTTDDSCDLPPPELIALCSPARPSVRGAGRRRVSRAVAALPPGVFHATREGHRHLLSSGRSLLIVDGYNLARAAWSGLAPQEERRRAVALLEEVRARSGGQIVVVFDGDSATVAPAHSRSIRVRFSSTGVTADDEMTALLAAVPTERPVVVVSSDRGVAADARRHGATVLTSHEFLVAAGR